MRQESDDKLMQKVCRGDSMAFARIVKRHHKMCFQLAMRMLFVKADAEDITQAVFLKIWQRPEQFDRTQGAGLRTWLYRITINATIDLMRKNAKRQVPDDDTVADNSLENLDRSIAVQQALGKLSSIQKAVVNLFYYEDLATKEVAEVLRISPRAVESHLMRARKNLKPYLKPELKIAS